MKRIRLTQGKFALVDNADFARLNRYKWHVDKDGYAVRTKHIGFENGKKITSQEKMHKVLKKVPAGFDVDHRDTNRLNNQRLNLRKAARSQNMHNCKPHRNSTSSYKGVSFDSENKKWKAGIGIDGKHKNLGRFSVEILAAIAYNKAAKKAFGKFARLNDVA